MIPAVNLLGLDFADLSITEAAGAIAARSLGAPFEYVVTPNADHIARLARDPELGLIYRNAWMRLMDSRVVAGLAWARGLRAPPVVAGSDLTECLLRDHVQPHERITIIGLAPSWLPFLIARHGLAEPFHYDPPMGFEHDPLAMAMTVSFVLSHPARFVFLAVGSPRQELLAAKIEATGRASGTGLCVGASLAFLAGAERRAPEWARRRGLEWAFRLAADPRRKARRYLLESPRVLPMLWREPRAGYPLISVPSGQTPDDPEP